MEEREPFAVVEFHDGFEVVKSEWGIFINNEMVACYFPCNKSKLEYMDLLKQTSEDVDRRTWLDGNGEPWEIKKFCTYAKSLEIALKKRNLYIELSEVDSDEAVNIERSKKSRSTRSAKGNKSPTNEDNTEESSKKGVKEPRPGPSKNVSLSQEFVNTEENNNHTKTVDVGKPTNAQNFPSEKGNGQKRKLSHDIEDIEEILDDSIDDSRILTRNDSSDNVIAYVKESTKLMLKKMNKIEMGVKSNSGNSGQENRPPIVSFLNRDGELEMFPAKNSAEITNIEEKLSSKSFFYKVVKALVDLGASYSPSMTVGNMLKQLLTFQAGQEFTFQGKSERKLAFSKLKLKSLISYAMKEVNKNVAQRDINKYISDWLSQCKHREVRAKIRAEKQRTSAREDVVNFAEE